MKQELTLRRKLHYWKRGATDLLMGGLCLLAAGLGLCALALILGMVVVKGMESLSLTVFTRMMAPPGEGGGLANAIVGSLMQAGLAMLVAAPLGIAIGIYLSEVGKKRPYASVVRFVNDILLSAPSVLVGLFVYQILVAPFGGFSGYAGAAALALIALPIIARTTEDMLQLVPQTYRDAAVALGARDSQVILQVIVPAAMSGILTGSLLAISRIAGETAPLIMTSLGNTNWTTNMSEPMASLPIAILRYAGSPFEDYKSLAWAGALIITSGVLVLNVLSRFLQYWMTGGLRRK